MYQPEKWIPRPKPVDVFRVSLDHLDDIGKLLNASSVSTSYMRGGKVLVEWTMMHRETFSALIDQYIVRNDRGEFQVLDVHELRADYQPEIKSSPAKAPEAVHPLVGKIAAVQTDSDNKIVEVLFELPDGSPANFVPKSVLKESDPVEVELTTQTQSPRPQHHNGGNRPGPSNQNRKQNNDQRNGR